MAEPEGCRLGRKAFCLSPVYAGGEAWAKLRGVGWLQDVVKGARMASSGRAVGVLLPWQLASLLPHWKREAWPSPDLPCPGGCLTQRREPSCRLWVWVAVASTALAREGEKDGPCV